MRRDWRTLASSVLLVGSALFCAVPSAAQKPQRHVLILHSSGRDSGSFSEVASSFQKELARLLSAEFDQLGLVEDGRALVEEASCDPT